MPQPHFSSQLLLALQSANNDNTIWHSHDDLLLWLVCIGGGLIPEGQLRMQYIGFVRESSCGRHFTKKNVPWDSIQGILQQFLWSDKAFLSPIKRFWEECKA